MNFNLETILTLTTLAMGLIWFADAAFFARRRRQHRSQASASDPGKVTVKPLREPWWVDYARSFFPVLLAVLLIRSFLVEPFHIPSSSMVPTLLVGDFILVNRYDYGLRLPVLDTKILSIGEPKRGQVIVFHYPEHSALRYCSENPICGPMGLQEVRHSAGTDYIKRVIGVPGDHIRYQNGTLFINGVRVPSRTIGPYTGPDVQGATLSREHIGMAASDILTNTYSGYPAGPDGEWTVPAREYFVMGDNRGDSFDSRYWGFVPQRDLVGRAMLIWFNIDAFRNTALWRRIGDVIH